MMSSRRGLRVEEHGAHRIGVEEHGGGKLPGAGPVTFDLLQMELVVLRKEWTNCQTPPRRSNEKAPCCPRPASGGSWERGRGEFEKSRSRSPPLIMTLSSKVGGARERGPPKMSTQCGAKLLKTEAVEFKNKKIEGFCVAVRHKC